jgi:hypothetical protein
VESGNKSLAQQRIKLAGIRWRAINKGQYMLTLMAKEKSGLWEKHAAEVVYSTYGVNKPSLPEFEEANGVLPVSGVPATLN